MKKFFTLLTLAMLVATGAQAQWKTSDTDYTVVGPDSVYGQVGMMTLRAADGSIVHTWCKTPVGMRYDNPAFGYYLHMQVFDKDGNAKFGSDGLIVNGEPGRSYITDYGLSLAGNGDILLSYMDTRDDTLKEKQGVYAYRYTTNGDPVWNKDGVRVTSTAVHNNDGEDIVPIIVGSGDNTYFTLLHSETYNVKADSTNWEPSPWFPNDTMPDSIQMEYSDYQIQRIADDGTLAWTANKVISASSAWFYPAPNGNLYIIYINAGGGIDARLIDKDGNDVWAEPVNIEKESISGGYYVAAPTVADDGQGGLMLAYRKLLSFSGYIVINRLKSDGTVYPEAIVCNGTTDGDGSNPVMGVHDGKALVAWEYTDIESKRNAMVNEFDISGDYVWEGDSLLGYSLAQNDMWGFKIVKVIPRDNGWVVLYGDAQSWNGANFYCVKIDENGNLEWKKQIAEDDFKSSGFSVVNDDNNAYIFYTCDTEYDDNWNEVIGAGGMRLMVVDITDATNGIASVRTNGALKAEAKYFTANGVQVDNMDAPGLYIVKDANGVRKVTVK